MSKKIYIIVFMSLLLLCSCKKDKENYSKSKGDNKMDIKISSSAFEDGGMIPSEYTCDGDDISPPLRWEDLPEKTKTIAIICDDPDAPGGTFVHWVLYDVPANKEHLDKGLPDDETFDNGTRQGITSFGKTGYGGPCPPSGTHRYFFKIYALDVKINTATIIDKEHLLKAMEGHLLGQGKLMGLYKRQK